MQLRLCLDQTDDIYFVGRVYTLTAKEPIYFSTFNQFTTKVDEYLNVLGKPQAFQEKRSMVDDTIKLHSYHYHANVILKPEKLLAYTGEKSTFDLHIDTRKNTEWQGRICNDKKTCLPFDTILELMDVICEK